MMRIGLAVAVAAVSLLVACGEAHFCASDGECKGNRVCRRSVCEDPGPIFGPDMADPSLCGCLVDNDCRGYSDPRGPVTCMHQTCVVCPPPDDAGRGMACVGVIRDAGVCP
jgi:hypothetical protein